MKLNRRILVSLSIVGTIVASCAIASPAVAMADDSVEIQTPMTIAGFDPAVAEANGYEIKTDADGVQYSEKKSTPGGVTTNSSGGGRIDGDCGYSTVKINGIGNLEAQLNTSWVVYAPVTAMNWQVSVIDQGGVSTQGWGPRPGPGTANWSDFRNFGGLQPGTIDAQVTTASSVTLQTGAFCYSGGPRDTGTVF